MRGFGFGGGVGVVVVVVVVDVVVVADDEVVVVLVLVVGVFAVDAAVSDDAAAIAAGVSERATVKASTRPSVRLIKRH